MPDANSIPGQKLLGLPKSVTVSADGETPRTTFFFYDARRNLIGTQTPDDQLFVSEFDQLDQFVRSTHYGAASTDGTRPHLLPTQFSYDILGAVSTVQRENALTHYKERDPLGRVKRVAAPTIAGVSLESSYTYDAYGYPASATDVDNRITTFEYEYGRLKQTQSPGVGNDTEITTNFQYSTSGALVRTEHASDGNTPLAWTENLYDIEGRVLATTTQHRGDISIVRGQSYDNLGRINSTLNAGGLTFYEYDDLDQLVRVHHPVDADSTDVGPSITRNMFNSVGQITGTLTPNDILSQSILDPFGQTVANISADPDGEFGNPAITTRFQRDAIGRLERSFLENSPQNYTRFEYDDFGRGHFVESIDPEITNRSSSNEFDSLGRLSKTTRNDGTVFDYEYLEPNLAQPTKITETTSDGSVRTTRTAYDAKGRVERVRGAEGTTQHFVYDDIAGAVQSFRWDATGQDFDAPVP
ncbi:MAG: hypothetical protein AAFP90_19185, partial [Planctomycetota bacterium]